MSTLPSFPLFDQLLQQPEPAAVDWSQLSVTIGNLPLPQAETVYALIVHYYLWEMNQRSDVSSLLKQLRSANARTINRYLYGCRTASGGRGVTFTSQNLPTRLQGLLALYIKRIYRPA